VLNGAVALLPVLAFLAALVVMDSFKLVPLRAVAQAIAAGALAAAAGLHLNDWLLGASGLGLVPFSRYVAPLLEETLKSLWVAQLVRRRRVGFLVDAAIHGFAVGAGFALLENVDYLRHLPERHLLLWVVRGLGTALLHGATSAVFALLAKSLADRHPERGLSVFLPGLLAATALHSLFNHFLVHPVLAAGLLLAVFPLVVVAVFERSERATREWLGAGFDLDMELLRLVLSGDFAGTRLGAYLQSLRARFPGPVVADMFCLLRVELELSVRAKGMLMARQAGLAMPVGADVTASLAELRYLERSIGRTGLLALKPLHVTSSRDLWHRHLLEQGRGEGDASSEPGG
jgi:RsiW-degrading membrane proteinase PrsW (M82 family)